MLARFNTDVIAEMPEYVIIMGGTNDIRHLQSAYNPAFVTNYSTDEAKINVPAMCDLAVANGIKPIICLIPPQGTNFCKVLAWNAWLTGYAIKHNYNVIDFYTPLNDPAAPGNIAAEYQYDAVHPNDRGMAVVVESINLYNSFDVPQCHCVNITAQKLNATTGTALQEWTDGNLDGISTFRDYTLFSYESTTLSGQPAYKIV